MASSEGDDCNDDPKFEDFSSNSHLQERVAAAALSAMVGVTAAIPSHQHFHGAADSLPHHLQEFSLPCSQIQLRRETEIALSVHQQMQQRSLLASLPFELPNSSNLSPQIHLMQTSSFQQPLMNSLSDAQSSRFLTRSQSLNYPVRQALQQQLSQMTRTGTTALPTFSTLHPRLFDVQAHLTGGERGQHSAISSSASSTSSSLGFLQSSELYGASMVPHIPGALLHSSDFLNASQAPVVARHAALRQPMDWSLPQQQQLLALAQVRQTSLLQQPQSSWNQQEQVASQLLLLQRAASHSEFEIDRARRSLWEEVAPESMPPAQDELPSQDGATRREDKPVGYSDEEDKDSGDRPKRPLSAYNIFFKYERTRIMDELEDEDSSRLSPSIAKGSSKQAKRGKSPISFQDMARMISKRWKDSSESTKAEYQKLAQKDKERYQMEKAVYVKRQLKDLERNRQQLEATVDEETMRKYLESGGQGSNTGSKKKATDSKKKK